MRVQSERCYHLPLLKNNNMSQHEPCNHQVQRVPKACYHLLSINSGGSGICVAKCPLNPFLNSIEARCQGLSGNNSSAPTRLMSCAKATRIHPSKELRKLDQQLLRREGQITAQANAVQVSASQSGNVNTHAAMPTSKAPQQPRAAHGHTAFNLCIADNNVQSLATMLQDPIQL